MKELGGGKKERFAGVGNGLSRFSVCLFVVSCGIRRRAWQQRTVLRLSSYAGAPIGLWQPRLVSRFRSPSRGLTFCLLGTFRSPLLRSVVFLGVEHPAYVNVVRVEAGASAARKQSLLLLRTARWWRRLYLLLRTALRQRRKKSEKK